MKPGEAEDAAGGRFTERQGEFLRYIYHATWVNGRPPAEAEIQRFFGITPPSVHTMILTLERKGLIARTPGMARSIRVLVPEAELPRWEAGWGCGGTTEGLNGLKG